MITLRNSRAAIGKAIRLRPSNSRLSHLLNEPGPSRCIPVYSGVNDNTPTRRSFASAAPREYPRPSRSLRYPRWINSRQNGRTLSRLDKPETEEGALAEDRRHTSTAEGHDATPNMRLDENKNDRDPASSSAASSSTGSDSGDDDGSSSSSSRRPRDSPATTSAISKQSVPEHYPQVLALPIARRPLFPGFYKAVVIRNPAVVAAIKEMMKRGQPYLGAFLLKDEHTDSDIISDINQVHHVGVFAQITSVFSATGGAAKDGEEPKDEGLTAVLYPHRRIRLTGLVNQGDVPSAASVRGVDGSVEESVTPPPSPEPQNLELDPQQPGEASSEQRPKIPLPGEHFDIGKTAADSQRPTHSTVANHVSSELPHLYGQRGKPRSTALQQRRTIRPGSYV